MFKGGLREAARTSSDPAGRNSCQKEPIRSSGGFGPFSGENVKNRPLRSSGRPPERLQILRGRIPVEKSQARAPWDQGNPSKPSAGGLQGGAGVLENVPAAELQNRVEKAPLYRAVELQGKPARPNRNLLSRSPPRRKRILPSTGVSPWSSRFQKSRS